MACLIAETIGITLSQVWEMDCREFAIWCSRNEHHPLDHCERIERGLSICAGTTYGVAAGRKARPYDDFRIKYGEQKTHKVQKDERIESWRAEMWAKRHNARLNK